MPQRSSSCVVVITSILVVFAAIIANANWGSGFGFSGPAAVEAASIQEDLSEEAALPSSEPIAMTTPLNAITTFDAALIARWVVQIPPAPIANQLTVANISGNTFISSFDASQVANYVLNNGNSTGSTGTIVPPGLLMGDVSGAGPHYDGSPGTPAVSLPTVSATPGILVVPITVDNVTGLGVISYEFQVTFDPTVLQPVLPFPFSTTSTLSNGWNILRNANNSGHLIISGLTFFDVLTGSGTLLNLRFHVIGAPGQSTALAFEDYTDPGGRIHQAFLFNEGTPSVITSNGNVTALAGPTLTPTNTATSTNTATPTSTPTATSTVSPTPTNTPVYPFAMVSLPTMAAVQATTISVPVTVSDTTGLGIVSYDLHVSFDPAVLTPASPAYDSTGTLSSGMSVVTDTSNTAHLILSADVPGANPPLAGSGTLIDLKFDVVGIPGRSTVLGIEDYRDPGNILHSGFRFNDGSVPVALRTNGGVTIAANSTPTPTYTGTPVATATATPVASPVIGGRVMYGNTLSPPISRPISNVLVSGAGPLTVSGLTDVLGFYELGGLGYGLYNVTPSKTAGTDILGSITSYDAALISQRVVGMITFNPTQQAVANVSGNTTVTSFDAAMIATFVAGPPYTGPGPGFTGTWRFLPSSVTHLAVLGPITDNFSALVMGEVSGNWNAAGPRPAIGRNGPLRNAAVAAPRVVTQADKEILVPIAVRGVSKKDIIAYEFDLRYDPSVIQPIADPADLAGTVSHGLSVVTNATEPGLLRVVVYGPVPIDNDGVLLNLRFRAVGKAGKVSPLTWKRIMFNEGEPRVNTTNGRVAISAAVSD